MAGKAFGETSHPCSYVPRGATEATLAGLERCVLDTFGPVVLTAPPGMGKSTLLRVLGERLDVLLSPVYLPYGAMSPAELCDWIVGLVAALDDGREPAETLRGHAEALRREGRSLLVLIDDADSLPDETARMVGSWIEETNGDICPVLAACEGAATERLVAATGPGTVKVSLCEPMSARETRLYVEYHLERAGVALDLCERFDAATVDWIFRRSGGVPRLVGELALRVIDPHLGDFEVEWSAETLIGEDSDDRPPEELKQD
ncbi:MAG: ATP-binding protein [Deltaproteobacteria bacterium]|nr:ATP-binding protein [Deltaproteobacteria bacterium]